ncbi:MAG: hypothetical protein J6D03_07260 [Clostridia bacterium]|nr:hypothetical protein [Clostridia bacterium]
MGRIFILYIVIFSMLLITVFLLANIYPIANQTIYLAIIAILYVIYLIFINKYFDKINGRD